MNFICTLSYRLLGLYLCLSFCSATHAKKTSNRPVATVWKKLANNHNLSGEEKKKLFAQDCKKFSALNDDIPDHNPKKEIRFMTYNVHVWKGKDGKNNLNGVLEVIQSVDPDIVCLQEVIWNKKNRSDITKKFKNIGFRYGGDQTFIAGKGSMGNIIFSKYPLKDLHKQTYKRPVRKEYRSFTGGTVIFNKQPVRFYCTHLDVWDTTEKARAEEITELLNHIQKQDKATKNVLIMGDFNAIRKEDYAYRINNKNVWQLLLKNDQQRNSTSHTHALNLFKTEGYKDTFTLTQTRPPFTVWSGKIVDFIFVKPKSNLVCTDTYVYYSSVSDHLPVISDFKVKGL